jgi:hypothetical protein
MGLLVIRGLYKVLLVDHHRNSYNGADVVIYETDFGHAKIIV